MIEDNRCLEGLDLKWMIGQTQEVEVEVIQTQVKILWYRIITFKTFR